MPAVLLLVNPRRKQLQRMVSTRFFTFVSGRQSPLLSLKLQVRIRHETFESARHFSCAPQLASYKIRTFVTRLLLRLCVSSICSICYV